MPTTEIFEYAVIRIVPKVERGEYLNAGVILYSQKKRYLGVRWRVDAHRLQALAPAVDPTELTRYLTVWDYICQGDPQGGPIAQLDLSGRFRWLTATRSTIIQPSEVHPGRCADPAAQLQALFARYVG